APPFAPCRAKMPWACPARPDCPPVAAEVRPRNCVNIEKFMGCAPVVLPKPFARSFASCGPNEKCKEIGGFRPDPRAGGPGRNLPRRQFVPGRLGPLEGPS